MGKFELFYPLAFPHLTAKGPRALFVRIFFPKRLNLSEKEISVSFVFDFHFSRIHSFTGIVPRFSLSTTKTICTAYLFRVCVRVCEYLTLIKVSPDIIKCKAPSIKCSYLNPDYSNRSFVEFLQIGLSIENIYV